MVERREDESPSRKAGRAVPTASSATLEAPVRNLSQVEKRNGRRVPFDRAKIQAAVAAAMVAVNDEDSTFASEVTHVVELALEEEETSLFTASVHDASLIESAHFYLSLRADAPETKLLAEVPRKVKVSSKDKIQELVSLALSGATLKHVPNPPSEIPVQPGHVYFELEKFGPHWEAVAASRTIAIYCPLGLPNLHLELLAVKG